ncbi:hypothetical protein [Pseudomonas savastanoi]|uniref:hypothetical protein n=3 Tax=Pseudomonas syringae group genomosp. 2 TaxID=251698 RepID=UPI00210EF085|nr:hypothetical protein [Pseudomonas savastanoi]
MAVGMDAFEYVGYSTGHYGKHRAAGLTLFFASVLTGETAHAIFNVDLTRKRTTASGKAGDPLPAGQFRVGERSHFYKFWLGTGLPFPRRLAAMHDYMGKLSSVLLTGSLTGDRINAGSLVPVTLTAGQFRNAVFPDNFRTSAGQLPDNIRTRVPDKEIPTGHESRALQPNSTACVSNHENKLIRQDDNKAAPTVSLPPSKPPQDQSVDEWLGAYDSLENDSVDI